ncbi:MAG: hypothetical protein WC491_03635 [Candidatus Omnitrophota bacterium]
MKQIIIIASLVAIIGPILWNSFLILKVAPQSYGGIIYSIYNRQYFLIILPIITIILLVPIGLPFIIKNEKINYLITCIIILLVAFYLFFIVKPKKPIMRHENLSSEQIDKQIDKPISEAQDKTKNR